MGCKWIYKAKLKADGSLECIKAQLVAKGFNQVNGVDFSKTFSPVIKPASIRLVLTLLLLKARKFINWMLKVHSCMALYLRQFTCNNV